MNFHIKNFFLTYFPLLRHEIQGLAAWYWVFIVIAILISLALGSVFKDTVSKIVSYLYKKDDNIDKFLVVEKLRGPIHVLLSLFFFLFFNLLVEDPRKKSAESMSLAIKIALFLSFVYLFYGLIDLGFSRLIKQHQNERSRVGLILPLSRRVSKTLLLIASFLILLSFFGVDVSAFLLGIGMGGVAIALAAKNILENLFGGAALSLDQPFQVGDYCKCGEILGYIEEIGLRSTRIRTLDRSLVTIPNSKLSEMHIENYTEREKIRLYNIIKFDLETPLGRLQELLSEFERILIENDNFYHDRYRVRLIGVSENGYEVEIYAFAKSTDWHEFVSIREDLFFSYVKKIDELGIKLAVPLRKNL